MAVAEHTHTPGRKYSYSKATPYYSSLPHQLIIVSAMSRLLRNASLRRNAVLVGRHLCRGETRRHQTSSLLPRTGYRRFSSLPESDDGSEGSILPDGEDLQPLLNGGRPRPVTSREGAAQIQWNEIISGPSTRLGTGTIANLTKASVVGTAGSTVVLSTVAVESSSHDEQSAPVEFSDALLEYLRTQSTFAPLTVTYEERYHGVGRIPVYSARRRDNGRPSDEEVLAGRAIDRALRPLLSPESKALTELHVHCGVQSHQVFAHGASAHPTALALNSASAALLQAGYLMEPVACVHMAGMPDGRLIVDPTPAQVKEASVELLYAGTRTQTVMMEGCSPTEPDGIAEESLVDLMRVAHAAIQPFLDIQEEMKNQRGSEPDETTDESIRASLGLLPLESTEEEESVTLMDHDASVASLVEEAFEFCHGELHEASLRLFGYDPDARQGPRAETVFIHPVDKPLLSKSMRGRREHLVYTEILRRLNKEFVPEVEPWAYKRLADEDSETIPLLARSIHKKLLQSALFETATEHGTRGDGRVGADACRTIRPVSVTVPALPGVVHGSSIFSRGETQVLCTTTLGAPRDGLPLRNPYGETTDPRTAGTEAQPDAPPGPYDHLPVGSLRFLRSQEALVSDLNSRKVKADKEPTGESGTLDEVQRFFLHYDFPSYSTGEVKKGGPANRRAIGHGTLAEKALRPVIPPPSDFPYAVRVTSEVTSSNGSSSMATICGGSLGLLDAGVPISKPVAGVSVGLALDVSNNQQNGSRPFGLLLDITGTEDHYGAMDFKVGGTAAGVTALQLDVKKPLTIDILSEALILAREGRHALLEEMKTLSSRSSHGIISDLRPRAELKDSAPRVEVIRFDPLRKRDLIGPGGAVLRQLEDRFGVSLDLSQDGAALLVGEDRHTVFKARVAIQDLVADLEEGETYEGTVIEIKDFGAIVELLRNKEGLLHVSELSDDVGYHPGGNFGMVSSILKIGQKIEVRVRTIDKVEGSVKLSLA